MIGFRETRHGRETIEARERVAVAVMTVMGVLWASLWLVESGNTLQVRWKRNGISELSKS